MAQIQTEMEDITNAAKSAEERAKKAITDVRMLRCFSLNFQGFPRAVPLGDNVNAPGTSWMKNQSVRLVEEAPCQQRVRATGNLFC